MYDIYFEEKKSIPDQQLVEIKFEFLENKPLEALESIYDKLNLPDFESIKKSMIYYLQSVKNHQKNIYPDLDQSMKDEIYNHWQHNFDVWGYER